jgi:hypothetical protein
MAKCPVCNSRKGKRKCLIQDAFICSLCCGQIRTADKCEGCSYFKDAKAIRNYKHAPYFSLSRMKDDEELQDISEVIEAAICEFDERHHRTLDDKLVLRIIELLLDKYAFNDKEIAYQNDLEEQGFRFLDQTIEEKLKNKSSEDLTKIIGTVYRSVIRHTVRRREYLEFVRDFVNIPLR